MERAREEPGKEIHSQHTCHYCTLGMQHHTQLLLCGNFPFVGKFFVTSPENNLPLEHRQLSSCWGHRRCAALLATQQPKMGGSGKTVRSQSGVH